MIQNVIPKELMNIIGTTITHLDIELKMKISRTDDLESKKLLYNWKNVKIAYLEKKAKQKET